MRGIRPRPAPGIGAKFLNHNRPATSMGRAKPVQVGSGRVGSKLPYSDGVGVQ